MEENISILKNRSVIKIFGKDNESFLNNIFTNDINLISQNDVIPSALLSPQGKIIFDVLIFNLKNSNYDEKTIFLECDNSQIQELIKKLKLYSLRQDVFIQETGLNVLTTNQANKFKNINKMILGCTHYHLIRENVKLFFKNEVEVLNSNIIVSKYVKNYLINKNLVTKNKKKQNHEFYVSNYTNSFEKCAKLFFKQKINLKQHKIK